ncbi:MAG: amidohydrolase family protein [Chloroflexota bacterium]|nr:amidohydrolase family protein [Chloroflexota bacterium]
MLPIIDTHQHLWDLNRFRLPWAAGIDVLNRSYLTGDYLAATEGLNVVQAVYMEVDVAPDQKVAEAEYIIDLCGRSDNPTVAAVIAGYPASEDFADYIQRFAGNSYIKGVRQVLHGADTPSGFCLSAAFVEGIRLLGRLDLSFDLCVRPDDLGDAVKLVDQCASTQFILDHCGNADPYIVAETSTPNGVDPAHPPAHTRRQWVDDITALGERPNVVCKISGIIARVRPGWTAQDLAPTINHCLNAFGPDRVIFGGDWPVCLLGASYQAWVNALKTVIADRSESDQRKLLHDNAVRIYDLAA